MAAAGVFTGLQSFIDSIMYASNVFAGSPDLAIAIQSSLVGYALMQLVVTYFSGVRVLIAPVSYEVIPFLVSLSAIVRAAVPAAQHVHARARRRRVRARRAGVVDHAVI